MQRLHGPNNSGAANSAGAKHCAEQVMTSVPQVVWFMRRQMRRHRGKLSMSQFRSLVRVEREPSVSLTAIADHVGTSISTTSRVVSGLVKRGYLARDTSSVDRRRVSVRITDKGHQVLHTARDATRLELKKVFVTLSAKDQLLVSESMRLLRGLFIAPGQQPSDEATPRRSPARRSGSSR